MSPSAPAYRLGLDLGSVSLKGLVLDPSGRIRFKSYLRTGGQPLQAAMELLRAMAAALGAVEFSGAVVTGSGKELISAATGIDAVNEIVAHATAAWTRHPGIESIIEIGGQDSKYIVVGRGADGLYFLRDHAFNELCAAGTGAFLDQQADRMGLDIERFSACARDAVRIAQVAGRCSVFAKSDMIHLQQRAVPADEIAAGFCYALARNYLATLCRGRTPPAPVLFQGGVAANHGVVRAFRELLNLDAAGLVVPEHCEAMGALGAALIAGERPLHPPLALTALIDALSRRPFGGETASALAPLVQKPVPTVSPSAAAQARGNTHVLGVDMGSASTKAVVVDSARNLIAAACLPTAGDPIGALKRAMHDIRRQLPGAWIAHAAATGSGRQLARALIGGGSVLDEISAQALSAAFFVPDADTVIEIGGQDSKFIRMAAGEIETFRMNRACAAGTGAFLEEQAGRLGIGIAQEFSAAAFRSSAPAVLGSRCTVFMDSDLVHYLQRGASGADLCAGLAYAIGRNYLEKVVGSNPVGEKIVFQGGVARNRAVHAVFENLLAKTIHRHPRPELSGALGAAFAALEDLSQGITGQPLRLDNLQLEGRVESVACGRCENSCAIRKVASGNRRPAYFGGVCGRFEGAALHPAAGEDAFAIRERLLHDSVAKPSDTCFRGEVGIPLTLTMCDYLPFWGTFFRHLGYRTHFSGATNRSIVAAGLRRVPAEFCYPVKILFGHVYELIGKGIRQIFIPHLRLFIPPGESSERYACPYTQAAPYVVRENVAPEAEILTFEYPVEREAAHWAETLAKALGVRRAEVESAGRAAQAAQDAFRARCRAEGQAFLSRLTKDGKRGAVLLGRPYNTADRHLSLNLARRLKGLGVEPIPFDFLPLEREPLPPLWERIRWGYGRKLVQAARALKHHPHLGAVIVTNFGCGPDAFVDQYLEAELKGVPHLLLELDDHQAEAGLVTRIEAFARNFKIRRSPPPPVLTGRDPGKPRRPLREYTYYVPAFMDHAYAITGALKASGCKTVLLPPTDDASWNLGLKHAYGRECHPFIAFAGDLLKAAERPGFVPEEACYFGPSYFGPCLLPQYPLALHLILERVGLAGVTVMNITDPTNMKELGRSYMVRLALGLYAIDRFYKWKTEIEPREAEKGSVRRVYREILSDLEKGLATGGFFRALNTSAARFRATPLRRAVGTRPRVGIVGDVFTRVNPHSNDQLYAKLNQMGFDVWSSGSVIDVSFLAMEQRHAELFKEGRPAAAAAAKALIPALKSGRRLIDRCFPDSIRTPQERHYPDVLRASSRYVSFWIDKVLSLNLNRIEELHRAGADGIINVMCHNCMLGTVTASLSKSIRKDIDDKPFCSLVFEGLKSTHTVNRLEAFAHQVRSFRTTRRGRKNQMRLLKAEKEPQSGF